jgi:hypothetical protein
LIMPLTWSSASDPRAVRAVFNRFARMVRVGL